MTSAVRLRRSAAGQPRPERIHPSYEELSELVAAARELLGAEDHQGLLPRLHELIAEREHLAAGLLGPATMRLAYPTVDQVNAKLAGPKLRGERELQVATAAVAAFITELAATSRPGRRRQAEQRAAAPITEPTHASADQPEANERKKPMAAPDHSTRLRVAAFAVTVVNLLTQWIGVMMLGRLVLDGSAPARLLAAAVCGTVFTALAVGRALSWPPSRVPASAALEVTVAAIDRTCMVIAAIWFASAVGEGAGAFAAGFIGAFSAHVTATYAAGKVRSRRYEPRPGRDVAAAVRVGLTIAAGLAVLLVEAGQVAAAPEFVAAGGLCTILAIVVTRAARLPGLVAGAVLTGPRAESEPETTGRPLAIPQRH